MASKSTEIISTQTLNLKTTINKQSLSDNEEKEMFSLSTLTKNEANFEGEYSLKYHCVH